MAGCRHTPSFLLHTSSPEAWTLPVHRRGWTLAPLAGMVDAADRFDIALENRSESCPRGAESGPCQATFCHANRALAPGSPVFARSYEIVNIGDTFLDAFSWPSQGRPDKTIPITDAEYRHCSILWTSRRQFDVGYLMDRSIVLETHLSGFQCFCEPQIIKPFGLRSVQSCTNHSVLGGTKCLLAGEANLTSILQQQVTKERVVIYT